jgi:YesN/AraC family two-component response regulator
MKILIVEDDFISNEYLKEIVLAQGYDCYSADNGKAGLQLYHQHKPDIILSDIQMPIMSGLEMLEEIRKEHSDVIVIMLTAFGSEEYAVQSFLKGANNYLKKPVFHKDILFLLKRYENELKTRDKAKVFPGIVIRRESTIKFRSEIEVIPQIVRQLVFETDKKFSDTEITEIEIGLNELIMNSIEHGNLEIPLDEKSKALEENRLPALYAKRQTDPILANRLVTVDFKIDLTGAEWLIRDEGRGFNWAAIPDPTQGKNIFGLNGRGIFITKFQFDEMEYLEKGNVVRIKKYLHGPSHK